MALHSDKVDKGKQITLDDLDESFTPEVVPVEFKKVVSQFFNSASKIYELYKRVVAAHKRCKLERSIYELIPEAVFAEKANRIKTTFNGYFYRIVEAKFMVERRKECLIEGNGVFFDWLAME